MTPTSPFFSAMFATPTPKPAQAAPPARDDGLLLPSLPQLPAAEASEGATATTSAGATAATPSARPIITPWERAKQAKLPSHRVHQITKAVVYHLVKDMRPYSTIDRPGFRNLLHVMEPRYTPPTRKTISAQIIPSWHNIEKENLRASLENVTAVGLTSDGWTSRSTDPYLTITAHYIDKTGSDWTLKSKVLQTEIIVGSHTGENLAIEIDLATMNWGIHEKTVAITVDNAANMGKAVLISGIDMKIGCFAHTLHLAACKTSDITRDITKNMRPTIAFFHKSHVEAQVLTEKQQALDLPKHRLTINVKTRWNSTYLMVERFLEQRPAIITALMDTRVHSHSDARKLIWMTDELPCVRST